MTICRVTPSKYLTSLSSATVWVKPNHQADIHPCLTTQPHVSSLCGQKGSASNPISFDKLSTLLDDVYHDKTVVIRFVSGEYGTLHQTYLWKQRVYFVGDNTDTVHLFGHHVFEKEGGIQQVTFLETIHIQETRISLQQVSMKGNSTNPLLVLENSFVDVDGFSILQTGPGGAIREIHTKANKRRSVWNQIQVDIQNELGIGYELLVEGTQTTSHQKWNQWSLESLSRDSCLHFETTNGGFLSCKVIDSTFSHVFPEDVGLSLWKIVVKSGSTNRLQWIDNELQNIVGRVFHFDISGDASLLEVTRTNNRMETQHGCIVQLDGQDASEVRGVVTGDMCTQTGDSDVPLYLTNGKGAFKRNAVFTDTQLHARSSKPVVQGIYQENAFSSVRTNNVTRLNEGTGDVEDYQLSNETVLERQDTNGNDYSERGSVQRHSTKDSSQLSIQMNGCDRKTNQGTIIHGEYAGTSKSSYYVTSDFVENKTPSAESLVNIIVSEKAQRSITCNTSEQKFCTVPGVFAKSHMALDDATCSLSMYDQIMKVDGGNGHCIVAKGKGDASVRTSGITTQTTGCANEIRTEDDGRFFSLYSNLSVKSPCCFNHDHNSSQPLNVTVTAADLIYDQEQQSLARAETTALPIYAIQSKGKGPVNARLTTSRVQGVANGNNEECPALICCYAEGEKPTKDLLTMTGIQCQAWDRGVVDLSNFKVEGVALETMGNTPCTMLLSNDSQLGIRASCCQAPLGELINAQGNSQVSLVSCDLVSQNGVVSSDETANVLIGANTITTMDPNATAFTNVGTFTQSGSNNVNGTNNQITAISIQTNPNDFTNIPTPP